MSVRSDGLAAPFAEGKSLEALIDRAPITPIQVAVVLLCTLVTFIEGVDLNLIPLLAPSISKAWLIPAAQFGPIFSAGPIGLIVGGFGVGWFADRFGRRTALISAMVLMTLATLATAWTRDTGQLMICRVLTGVGFGGLLPPAASLVSEFLPTRTRASVVAFVILGQAAGGLVASLLMKTELSALWWQTTILYMGGACALTTLLLVLLLPESPRYLLLRHAGSPRAARLLRWLKIDEAPAVPVQLINKGNIRALFTDGRALGTCLLWAVFIGICAPVSFFTNWLRLIYTAAGQPTVGIDAAAAYWAGSIAGGLVLPLFCLRWNVNVVLMAVVLAAAACCAGLGSVMALGDLVNLCVAFACGVFISGAFYLMYPPAVRFYPTAARSTGIGAAVAFGRIGNVLSPLAAGWMLGASFTPASVFWAMALPLALSLFALLAFHRLTRDQPAAL